MATIIPFRPLKEIVLDQPGVMQVEAGDDNDYIDFLTELQTHLSSMRAYFVVVQEKLGPCLQMEAGSENAV